MTVSYDVGIVGLGPVGATLANLLSNSGVSVVVLDRETGIYPLPRAVHIDDETMRVFQSIGIADSLGMKMRVNPGMRFVRPDGVLLLDWPRPDKLSESGWHASYRLHQPDLEHLLRAALNSHTKKHDVTILLGCNVEAIVEHAEDVEIQYSSSSDRVSASMRCRYVVGCDGAGSLVRQLIEKRIHGNDNSPAAMQDLGFKERWLVVDMLLKRPCPDLGDYTLQICDPERPMTYCRNPGDRRRWEIALRDDEGDELMQQPSSIWPLLSLWITDDDAVIERQAVYTFRSAIAKNWRAGRLLIAGDAAHLTPPFMGQGLCAGIRDVGNLGWKLVAALQGDHDISDKVLLDSYQAERHSHVQAYIETAMKLGRMMSAIDGDETASSSAASKATDSDSAVKPPVKMESIRPRLGESPLMPAATNSAAGGEPASPAEQLVGRQFPQPRMADNQRFDDFIGQNFVVVLRQSARQGTRQNQENAIVPGNVSIIDSGSHPLLDKLMASLGLKAVLVRPDRYVAAIARSDSECDSLIEIIKKVSEVNGIYGV